MRGRRGRGVRGDGEVERGWSCPDGVVVGALGSAFIWKTLFASIIGLLSALHFLSLHHLAARFYAFDFHLASKCSGLAPL